MGSASSTYMYTDVIKGEEAINLKEGLKNWREEKGWNNLSIVLVYEILKNVQLKHVYSLTYYAYYIL